MTPRAWITAMAGRLREALVPDLPVLRQQNRDLRADYREIAAQRDIWMARAFAAEADLARLTTLRPYEEFAEGDKLFWGKDGSEWVCDPLFVRPTHWTPTPDVKQAK